jgi:hypothetical protein
MDDKIYHQTPKRLTKVKEYPVRSAYPTGPNPFGAYKISNEKFVEPSMQQPRPMQRSSMQQRSPMQRSRMRPAPMRRPPMQRSRR